MTNQLGRTRRLVLTLEAEELQSGRHALDSVPGNVDSHAHDATKADSCSHNCDITPSTNPGQYLRARFDESLTCPDAEAWQPAITDQACPLAPAHEPCGRWVMLVDWSGNYWLIRRHLRG
ncbi:hypothetical protein [Nocardia sp. NPDC059229]|uniref:hypothetical protein n=1 Tax=Nocardia sp. NPDC059229 TaxID=3346778 RepID=UPI0036C78ED2